MENLNKQDRNLIGYRVELVQNTPWDNPINERSKKGFPFEIITESAILARSIAFINVGFGGVRNELFKPNYFRIFLMDKSTGIDYLICTGEKPTIEVMPNLELECNLYEKYGFQNSGLTIIRDDQGKEYRVIDSASMFFKSELLELDYVAP